MHSRAWFISPLSRYSLGNLCVWQATQGYPVNKGKSHSFRGLRKLETPHLLGQQRYISRYLTHHGTTFLNCQEALFFSFALALTWMCWKFILLLLLSKWLFPPQAPVGSWPALRCRATWVTLMRHLKGCHHLVAIHLASWGPSHWTVAHRLGHRELLLYIT